MKINVVSKAPARAEQLAKLARSSGSCLEVGTITSPGQLSTTHPSLLIIDGVDAPGLDSIGRLMQTHPTVEIIVVSTDQSIEFLKNAMQLGVRAVLEVGLEDGNLQVAIQRAVRKQPSTTAKHGEVLAFMSCKGGSGASFLAANLAHILSKRRGCTVALLDLDMQFGDALMMVSDQRATSDVSEISQNVSRLDADLLRSTMVHVSDTLAVLAAPEELSAALDVKAAHVEAIVRQAQSMFDFVVLDVGSSIDTLSLQALDLATRIFPVVQLNLPQLRSAKRLSGLFRSLEYPPQKIHWLVNRYRKDGDVALESLEQTLGVHGIVTVPNHFVSVSTSVNQGVPIERLAPSNPVVRALAGIARTVAPVEEVKKNWYSNLFKG